MLSQISYLHLQPGSLPPEMTRAPSRFVVIVDGEVTPEWKKLVSDWIVASGCLYMMAWGCDCSSWDDSVDWANMDKFGESPIPDDEFVFTTWHEDEPLSEVFWFSKSLAYHDSVDIVQTVILDISAASRKDELLSLYKSE